MADSERFGSARDRRIVTVLFADISGFTSLSERLDPEVMTDFLRDCVGGLVQEVAARGGWVEKQIGDAILAVFGAPVAHEDDAVRAVHSALAMLERMHAMSRRFAAQLGSTPALHIGVNTGLVVMGPPLAGDAETAAAGPIVIGDTVNVGARLQQAAGNNQILVGEKTFEATRPHFDYRPVSSLKVKGKQLPLVAFECRGKRTGSAHDVLPPFLDRESELETLTSLLDRHEGDGGHVIAIVGEAGIGKSRFVHEARDRATHPDRLWLEGRAVSYGSTLSYWPFVEAIRSWAGLTSDETADEGRSKLEHRLRHLADPTAATWLPHLAAMLGLDLPAADDASSMGHGVGGSTGAQLLRACRRFFGRLADDRQLVLLLEDLHWADRSSMLLIEHLLPLVPETPLLVVLTWRAGDDEATSVLREHITNRFAMRFTEIELGPLPQAVAAKLVEHVLPLGERHPSAQRQIVLERARGNPFFLREMALVLSETESGADAPIPDSLRGVIVSRIDQLPAPLTDVLRTAAVIGRDFTPRMLGEVGHLSGDARHSLAELVARGFLETVEGDPEDRHSFAHPLVHEVVYESTLLAQRRELHRRAGRLLAGADQGIRGKRSALLAFHASRAEDWDVAKRYLLLAGDHAAQIAADAESLHLYREAMLAHDRIAGGAWEPLERAQLERKMGEALARRGDHSEGIASLHQALVHLGTPFPRRVRPAIAREFSRRAARRLRPPARLEGATAARERERALIYERAAWIDYFLDPERFVLDILMLLNGSELIREDESTVNAAAALAIVLDLAGMHGVARRYLARALELSQRIRSDRAEGAASLGEGVVSYNHGRWQSAIDSFERSAAAYRRVDDLHGWGTAVSVTPWLLGYQGRLRESLERSRELARVAEEAGAAQLRAWGLMGIGKSLRQLGDVEGATAPLTEAVESFRTIPDPLSVSDAMCEVGLLELRRGDVDRAIITLQDAVQLAVDSRLKGFITTQGYAGLAAALLLVAECTDGRDRERALAHAKDSVTKSLRIGKVVRPGKEAAYRARGSLAWLRGRPRSAMKWWRRSLALSQQLGSELERGLTELEIGTRLHDRSRLGAAEEIFARLDAKLELEDARATLAALADDSPSAPPLVR